MGRCTSVLRLGCLDFGRPSAQTTALEKSDDTRRDASARDVVHDMVSTNVSNSAIYAHDKIDSIKFDRGLHAIKKNKKKHLRDYSNACADNVSAQSTTHLTGRVGLHSLEHVNSTEA